MKKLIVICALLTSVSFVSYAQTTEVKMQPAATTIEEKAGAAPHKLTDAELKVSAKTAAKNTKVLQAKLGLTKAQYDEVYKLEYRFQSQCDRYSVNGAPAPKGACGNLTSERNINMKKVLTPQQFEKYQAMSQVTANK